LARLIDMGIKELNSLLLEMSSLSEKAVAASIDAYREGGKGTEVRDMSNRLAVLHRQVSDLAMEVIARYQPVASDLRFLKSCLEVSYGFFRYGRYAKDIVEVLEMFGDVSKCDHGPVEATARKVQEMIRLSGEAFARRDVELARRILPMDDTVDESYRGSLMKVAQERGNLKCVLSMTLIMRYLERIADHATYIGESVDYIVTGVEPAH
jgi:phosphate transport system protein